MPGFRAAAVKEKSDSKRGCLPNSIAPSTELRGVEGKASSKSSYAASVPKTFDALENRELFRTRDEQGGTQLLKGVESDLLVLDSFLLWLVKY